MKFIELPFVDFPPGRLAVWRAGAPPMSSAAWFTDRRRASHDQEAHITSILDEVAGKQAPPPSWLGCAFDLPGEFDADAFTTALRQWIDHHEILRSHSFPSPLSTPGERLCRVTLAAGAVSVHSTTVGNFADGRQLADHLEDLFDRSAGPLVWPGYLCATIHHRNATTVCLAADHSLMDGYSVLRAVHELQSLYAGVLAAADGSATSPCLPAAASHLDFAEAERSASAALTIDHPSMRCWRQFLVEAGDSLPPFPVAVGASVDHPAIQPSGYVELLDAPATQAFDHACRLAGGDAFAGVLACLARLGRELGGSGDFRTMAPFNTRTDRFRSSIGWYVGMAPVAFRSDAADSFAKTLRAAAAGLDEAREFARIPMPRVAELLGRALSDPFMVSYSDFRRTLGARHWNAWRTVVLRARSTSPHDVYFWIVRDHDGLSVSYRHPATAAAATAVPRYVERARQLLAGVASSGAWPASPTPALEPCL